MAERRVAARLSTSRLKRRRERTRVHPRWRDRATQTDLGQGATHEICKLVPETSRDTEIKRDEPEWLRPSGSRTPS